MSVTSPAPPSNGEAPEPGSWLRTEVDGRPVGFWLLIAVAIAALTLGSARGRSGASDATCPWTAWATRWPRCPGPDVRLPAVAGRYEGDDIFFVQPRPPIPRSRAC
jgi:hypothetical protein